jgi:hypothetical protein
VECHNKAETTKGLAGRMVRKRSGENTAGAGVAERSAGYLLRGRRDGEAEQML